MRNKFSNNSKAQFPLSDPMKVENVMLGYYLYLEIIDDLP